MMRTTFVSAYYDIPNKYGGVSKYKEWITNFLGSINQIHLVLFSTGSSLEWLKTVVTRANIVWVDLPIEQFELYKYKTELEQQKELDPEKDIHSMELYLLWNEKAFFVHRAIEMDILASTHYCWIDIGMVREERLCSILDKFPNEQSLKWLYSLNKMCILGIEPSNLSSFSNRDTNGISTINRSGHTLWTVGGGYIFGPKKQYLWYIESYLRLFRLYIQRGVFVGKDQNVIANLIINEPEQFSVIDQTQHVKLWMDTYQPNVWLRMINLLSGLESFKPTHTPELMGGLGNQLFQVAMVYSVARLRNDVVVLNRQLTHRNPHSQINYIDTVFRKFIDIPCAYTDQHREQQLHIYDLGLFNGSVQHRRYWGYYQNYRYIAPYLDDFRRLLSFPDFRPVEEYFIHFRFGDFVNNRNHQVDLSVYYNNCLKLLQNRFGKVRFRIFSNDRQRTSTYIRQHLELYLQPEQYSIIVADELQTMAQMMRCKGGICSNSTFSWWAGMLNSTPNKIIYFPDRIYPKTSMYSHVNVSGMFHPDFTIISTMDSV